MKLNKYETLHLAFLFKQIGQNIFDAPRYSMLILDPACLPPTLYTFQKYGISFTMMHLKKFSSHFESK